MFPETIGSILNHQTLVHTFLKICIFKILSLLFYCEFLCILDITGVRSVVVNIFLISCICILLMFFCPVGSFVLTVMFMLAFIHRLWVAKQIIGKSNDKKFSLSIFQEFQ